MGEVVEVDGERYTWGRHTKDGALTIKKIDQAKHDALVDKLAKKLIKFVDREEIIKDALSELHPNALKRVDRRLRKNKEVKKKRGCLSLDIGGESVYLRG